MDAQKMIHYHGLPITPASSCIAAIAGGHAFVSYRHKDQLPIAMEVCQSFAVDNGAFSAWKSGEPVADWTDYYRWTLDLSYHPGFDFAAIPDVIDGTEAANDKLVREWPLGPFRGAPVWHMHESLGRLAWLARDFPRVCIGSSGEYATVGSAAWWRRMNEAMNRIADKKGRPTCKLHGLRMLDPEIFTRLPLSSADSTNIAQNVGIDSRWTGAYSPPSKDVRATVLRTRIESFQSAASWIGQPVQQAFFQDAMEIAN